MNAQRSAAAKPFQAPLYSIVVGLWLVYAALNFLTPVKEATNIYHLNTWEINALRLSFIVPYLLIWLLGAFSYLRLQNYIASLDGGPEGVGYRYFSQGILLLLGSMTLSAVAGALRQLFFGTGVMSQILVIVTNYLYVVPILGAFILFYAGARLLVRQDNQPQIPPIRFVFYMLPLVALTYIWLDLIFTNTFRYSSPSTTQVASYYLSDSLIVLTIVMPTFLAWTLALLTVVYLRHYLEKSRGTIFRQSLSSFVQGMVGVTVGSIFIQGLLSLGPGRLQHLGLGTILLIIYFFLFLQGVGFAFIARGARRLRKIETA